MPLTFTLFLFDDALPGVALLHWTTASDSRHGEYVASGGLAGAPLRGASLVENARREGRRVCTT